MNSLKKKNRLERELHSSKVNTFCTKQTSLLSSNCQNVGSTETEWDVWPRRRPWPWPLWLLRTTDKMTWVHVLYLHLCLLWENRSYTSIKVGFESQVCLYLFLTLPGDGEAATCWDTVTWSLLTSHTQSWMSMGARFEKNKTRTSTQCGN